MGCPLTDNHHCILQTAGKRPKHILPCISVQMCYFLPTLLSNQEEFSKCTAHSLSKNAVKATLRGSGLKLANHFKWFATLENQNISNIKIVL